jgi:hypothetical protein
MHLLIAFAAPLSEGARAALPALATPALDNVLARWVEVRRDAADENTLSPPHERAHAAALGMTGADGCLPWAARQAAIDGIEVGYRAWGLLTPVHWRIGSDGVHLADPDALALSDADSRALFEAVRPLFESEGYTMAWGAALRWYAAHDALQGLATASLDRVIGRNIDAWLPRQREAKPLRRLQNEVQMLLHAHPLNDAREAAGALPVNSFWLSGCGARQAEQPNDLRFDDRLRAPSLSDDGAAWLAAWQAVDADAITPLLAVAQSGEAVRLTLCGERSNVEFVPRPRAWWQRVVDTLSPARTNARSLLETL